MTLVLCRLAAVVAMGRVVQNGTIAEQIMLNVGRSCKDVVLYVGWVGKVGEREPIQSTIANDHLGVGHQSNQNDFNISCQESPQARAHVLIPEVWRNVLSVFQLRGKPRSCWIAHLIIAPIYTIYDMITSKTKTSPIYSNSSQ